MSIDEAILRSGVHIREQVAQEASEKKSKTEQVYQNAQQRKQVKDIITRDDIIKDLKALCEDKVERARKKWTNPSLREQNENMDYLGGMAKAYEDIIDRLDRAVKHGENAEEVIEKEIQRQKSNN